MAASGERNVKTWRCIKSRISFWKRNRRLESWLQLCTVKVACQSCPCSILPSLCRKARKDRTRYISSISTSRNSVVVDKSDDFVSTRDKPLNMILQSFIEPCDRKNMLIKVKWTPQNAAFHRMVNKHDLYDSSIELKDRVTTFDGMPVNCSIGMYMIMAVNQTSPAVTKDLEKIILNMVNTIKEVSGFNTNINSMTLFFKIDDSNRIWFLYCSRISIRTSEKDPWFKDLFRSAAGTREDSPAFRYTVYDKLVQIEDVENRMRLIASANMKKYEPDPNQKNCTICLRMPECHI